MSEAGWIGVNWIVSSLEHHSLFTYNRIHPIPSGFYFQISSIQTNYVGRVIAQNCLFAALQSQCEMVLFCSTELYFLQIQLQMAAQSLSLSWWTAMSWLNLSGPIDPRRKPLLLKWHSLFNSFRGNLIHSGVCIQNILTNSHKNIAIAVIVYFFKFKTLFPGIDFFSFTSQWIFGFLDSDSLRNTGHRNLKRHRHI